MNANLACIPAELAERTAKDARYLDGPPLLMIKILSPRDTFKALAEKTHAYLEAGVPLVWEVNPFTEVVAVYRPGLPPEHFNVTQEITAEPHLPGFRVSVAEIFAL